MSIPSSFPLSEKRAEAMGVSHHSPDGQEQYLGDGRATKQKEPASLTWSGNYAISGPSTWAVW